MFTELESLLWLALKSAFDKTTVAAAAHASPTVLDYEGVQAASKVPGKSSDIRKAIGGQAVVGHGVVTTMKFSKKVLDYRDKQGTDGNGRRVSTYLGKRPSSMVVDLHEAVIQSASQVKDQMIKEGLDFDEIYALCKNQNESGLEKTKVDEIRECNECLCDDFETSFKSGSPICNCGHASTCHKRPEDPFFMVVVTLMAVSIYPELQHYDVNLDRLYLTGMTEHTMKNSGFRIRPCLDEPGCPCADFNARGGAFNCSCGHSSDKHREPDVNYSHMFVALLVEYFYNQLGHKNWQGERKWGLDSIKPCSRVDCGDFNLDYNVPFFRTAMCVCGCSNSKHEFIQWT